MEFFEEDDFSNKKKEFKIDTTKIIVGAVVLTLVGTYFFSNIKRDEPKNKFDISQLDLWPEKKDKFIRLSGINISSNENLPNPRKISNILCRSKEHIESEFTTMMIAWNQFILNDICQITHNDNNSYFLSNYFDVEEVHPNKMLPYKKPEYVFDYDVMNNISSFLDLTSIYGKTKEETQNIRLNDGSGKIKLINSRNGEEILEKSENVLVSCLQTLFAREHNRLCDQIVLSNSNLNDDFIFVYAKFLNCGFVQNITFSEYLPLLIGCCIPKKSYYKPNINTTPSYEFLMTFDHSHNMINYSNFFSFSNDEKFLFNNGINKIIKSLCFEKTKKLNEQVIEDFRNQVYDKYILDFSTIKIQKARDCMLPSLNQVRQSFNLPPIKNFSEINSYLEDKLESLYDDINDVDAWVGCFCEPKINDSQFGYLGTLIIKEQFERFRDGDKNWYEFNSFLSEKDKKIIKSTTLKDIILRNTNIKDELYDNVFYDE